MSVKPKQSLGKGEGVAVGTPSGEKKSRNSKQEFSHESDSFYKYYNKEIKVNQDEIPIVLSELIDAAYNYIQRESYEKALILLQKTEGVLDVINLEKSKRDKYIAFTAYHNMAMCYQKLGLLDECLVYLKNCLQLISSAHQPSVDNSFYKENSISSRMRQIKQECKLKLQLCAILSQTQNHSEALDNAKKSVKLAHQLFKDLHSLCLIYMKKIDQIENLKGKKGKSEINNESEQQISILSSSPLPQMQGPNFLEESISMIERTSLKLLPIIQEVLKRMIEEKNEGTNSMRVFDSQQQLCADILYSAGMDEDADMRSVLGYLNQNEWIYSLNIGNIMQIQPINLKDLLSNARNETELTRDSFLEKISLLSVSYFCVSTEMRFLLLSREQYLSTPVKMQRELESEFWHAKALEMACSFLPSECPLLNHVLLSYQKHHDPSMQPIKEDQEQTDVLNVLRPLPGIESNKYQPIIRYLQNIKVVISPFPLSPLTKRVVITDKKNQLTDKLQGSPDPPTGESMQKEAALANQVSNFKDMNWGVNKSGYENFLKGNIEASNSSANYYSEDYYEQLVKSIIENPQVDKKELVKRIISCMQSQDFALIQSALFNQSEEEKHLDNNPEKAKAENLIPAKIKKASTHNHLEESGSHSDLQKNQHNSTTDKKQEEDNLEDSKRNQRVQKLMSYLEGDSLLRDIQKSLNNDDEEDAFDEDDGNASDSEAEAKAFTGESKKGKSNDKNKSLKSGQSFTRPSSSMTYHTQSSQLRKRKMKDQLPFQSNKLTSQISHPEGSSSNSRSSSKLQRRGSQFQRKSVQPGDNQKQNFSKIKKELGRMSQAQKQLFMQGKHTSSVSQYNQKNNKAPDSSSKNKNVVHHNHLRSQMGSRLSNLFATNKTNNLKASAQKKRRNDHGVSVQNKNMSSSGLPDGEEEKKTKVKKYKRNQKNIEDISIDHELEKQVLTEGTPQQLLQPSENIAHTYSFDIGMPQTHKNFIKESNNSLNNLQQQVLQNQKILKKLQATHSDSKKSQKPKKFSNLRQSGLISQFNKVLEQQNTEASRMGGMRSKSTWQSKGTQKGGRGTKDSQQRQSCILQNQTFSKQNTKNNKENVSYNPKMKKKQQSIGHAQRSSNKKHGGGQMGSGVQNINKELEFLKNKMKEHFKFFSQYSPELKKKRKAGSHSPPNKSNSNSRQNKMEKGKLKSQQPNLNQIFATADQRVQKKGTDPEDVSWMLNEQSFNEFVRNTLGSNEDKLISAIEQEIERPSLGGGIHRGSSDIIMFAQGQNGKPSKLMESKKKKKDKSTNGGHPQRNLESELKQYLQMSQAKKQGSQLGKKKGSVEVEQQKMLQCQLDQIQKSLLINNIRA